MDEHDMSWLRMQACVARSRTYACILEPSISHFPFIPHLSPKFLLSSLLDREGREEVESSQPQLSPKCSSQVELQLSITITDYTYSITIL